MAGDEGGVSHQTLADMMTRGFSEQRESVRRVHEKCDVMAKEMASEMSALRAEQARIAENSTHMAVTMDRTEKGLIERIDAVQRDALSWRRVFGDTLKLIVKSAPVVIPLITLVGILRGWFASVWPWD